jgi:carbamoyl-phosphate synthase large subunit
MSKAIGIPLAQLAARIAVGKTLEELRFTSERNIEDVVYAIKAPIFPFNKFIKEDPILKPEMRSTGEVMGLDPNFSKAFLKAKLAEGVYLPTKGTVFISVNNNDKRQIVMPAMKFYDMGFRIVATRGTAKVLRRHDIEVTPVYSMRTGSHPNIRDYIENGEIDLIINTPTHGEDYKDEENIRIMALRHNIPCITTIPGAIAAVNGIAAFIRRDKNGGDNNLSVVCLQDLYQSMRERIEVEK